MNNIFEHMYKEVNLDEGWKENLGAIIIGTGIILTPLAIIQRDMIAKKIDSVKEYFAKNAYASTFTCNAQVESIVSKGDTKLANNVVVGGVLVGHPLIGLAAGNYLQPTDTVSFVVKDSQPFIDYKGNKTGMINFNCRVSMDFSTQNDSDRISKVLKVGDKIKLTFEKNDNTGNIVPTGQIYIGGKYYPVVNLPRVQELK